MTIRPEDFERDVQPGAEIGEVDRVGATGDDVEPEHVDIAGKIDRTHMRLVRNDGARSLDDAHVDIREEESGRIILMADRIDDEAIAARRRRYRHLRRLRP